MNTLSTADKAGKSKDTIFLIDGHALAYRAYFAFIRNPLFNSKGENTSAVFGFTRMLLMLLERYNPKYAAVVFDSAEETQRHRDFPEYKANREEMPDDMSVQLPWIFDVIEAMGIKVILEPGYEADDIIATLAKRSVDDGFDVRIVTGDKDFFQLISDRIYLIRPVKGTSLDEEAGPGYLEKKYGITPSQVVDFLALMGDKIDNIPGVRGIGEKTAIRLLKEYGSIEKIYESINEVPSESLKKKLVAGKDDAFLSYDLVKLKEVPVDVKPEELLLQERNEEKLIEIFLRLDFHQFLKELSLKGISGRQELDYSIVRSDNLEALADYLASRGEFVFDTETTSLDPMRAELVGISFCAEEKKAFYVPVFIDVPNSTNLFDSDSEGKVPMVMLRNVLGPLMTDGKAKKIGHNIKYDKIVLENHGIHVEGISFDTMIASYLLDPERHSHSLDNLSIEFLKHRMIQYKELFEKGDKGKDIKAVPVERLAEYSCEDADFTMRLKNIFEDMLKAADMYGLFERIEVPLLSVLVRMEMSGVRLDVDRLDALSKELASELDRLSRRIFELAGESFNINSNKQLQRILFKKLELPSARKTKTGYSTDYDVLIALAEEHEIASVILEYRQLSKLKSTYIDALPKLVNPKTGRIHTSFNQTVTSTGRLSSSNPNLQNIPIRTGVGREVRSAFIPSEGRLILDADYSQIELRIMAHLSKDEELMNAFREGVDVHTRTASRIYGIPEDQVTSEMRSRAKTINFGVIYGMGARGLSKQLGISIEEAKGFIDEYFKRYPGVRDFVERSKEEARRRGYAETILGRRRLLPDIDSKDGRMRSFSERIAVNMPVQGTAADMIKIAMINIDREITKRDLKSRMIIQVHDELVFDMAEDETEELIELVVSKMESAVALDVPIKVDVGVGKNWLEAHK